MMDEKRLEQKYRELKHQAAPDLWARIEGNLKDHPERAGKAQHAETIREFPQRKRGKTPVYGMAAAAAAILVLVAAVPQLDRIGGGKSAAPMMNQAAADSDMEAAPMDMAPENTAQGDAAIPETQEMALSSEVTAAENSAENSAGNSAGKAKAAGAAKDLPDGVLSYGQLQLTSWQPLQVPEQAVTVPEDSQYFSEGILGDTELLCGATVISAELETDHSGKAVKVVYELELDQVYYAEDYTAGMDRFTVKSPIIKTDGDEAYVLYQLLPEGTYLLPLKKQDGDWELLYPFAPQIQVTGEGAYLFHSGYVSLVTEDTSVVIGSQEGANDYYYDRMLLREDDNFLSDFVSLVEHQAQGRKKE